MLVAGPSVLNLWAAIDQTDTNWIVVLKDVGPDPSVHTAREGEWDLAPLHERELTRGWLKASNRALDPERTQPRKPFHRPTREALRAHLQKLGDDRLVAYYRRVLEEPESARGKRGTP